MLRPKVVSNKRSHRSRPPRGFPSLVRKIALAAALSGGLLFNPALAQTGDDEADQQPTQDRLSTAVQKMATGIDNFFSNQESDWTTNKTRVIVRANTVWVEDHGTDFEPQVKVRLVLPGLEDRLRLVLNDDDDDTLSGGRSNEDESNLALRYVFTSAKTWGTSFDLGVSTRGDPSLQGYGRLNLFRRFRLGNSKWEARAENRLYWYTDSNWRNDFNWYFERLITDKLFFRSRTRFDYQEDKNENVLPEQRFTLYHQINNNNALAYEAIAQQVFFEDSVFDEDEFLVDCEKCNQYQLRLRYRHHFKRFPRFFYEIWPIAGWSQVRDYAFTPAIYLRLEVVLGDVLKSTKLE